jgi:hypothetical protein
MCEELEYSDLLDGVSDVKDPFERMVSHLLFEMHLWLLTGWTRAFSPDIKLKYEESLHR